MSISWITYSCIFWQILWYCIHLSHWSLMFQLWTKKEHKFHCLTSFFVHFWNKLGRQTAGSWLSLSCPKPLQAFHLFSVAPAENWCLIHGISLNLMPSLKERHALYLMSLHPRLALREEISLSLSPSPPSSLLPFCFPIACLFYSAFCVVIFWSLPIS